MGRKVSTVENISKEKTNEGTFPTTTNRAKFRKIDILYAICAVAITFGVIEASIVLTISVLHHDQRMTRTDSNAAIVKLEEAIDIVSLGMETLKSQQSAQAKTTVQLLTGFDDMLIRVRLIDDKVAGLFLLQEIQDNTTVKLLTRFNEILVRINLTDDKVAELSLVQNIQENDSESAVMMAEKNVTVIKAVIDSFCLELDTVKSDQDKTNAQLLTGFDEILAKVNMTDCKVERLSLLEEVHERYQSGCGYLVSGVYGVPDQQLTASSSYDAHHGPTRGRLNNMSHSIGAWSSATADINQWIQVELNNVSRIIKVTTQGRKDNSKWNQWVTSYKVQYSMDGTVWLTVKTCYGQDQVFTGNTDRNTLVTNVLQQPIRARFVRLLPQTWHNYISMRFDITGCPY